MEQSSNDIRIPLLRVQKEYMQATEKMVAIVSSRSCGKSFVATLHSLLTMMNGNNVVYFVQNLEAWAKGPKIHFYHFLRELKQLDNWTWNGSTYTGTLKTPWGEAKFYLGTYGNPDAVRGATEVSLVTLDEFMLSSPEMLAAIAPIMRGKNLRGEMIHPMIRMVSTPNMSSPWQLMVLEHEKHGIKLLRAKMTENYFISDEQRELMAKSIFDDKLRLQEVEGEILLGDNSTSMCSLSDFSDRVVFTNNADKVWAGLDMAHSGDRDKHVFAAVQGLRVLDIHEFGKADSSEVALYIKKFNKDARIAGLNIDLAWSESVYDQLKYEIPCTQIPFGGAAEHKEQYANIRAEMLFKLAKRVKDGLYIPDDCMASEVKRELTNIHWMQMTNTNKLIIEPKSDVRIRLGRSPDVTDALALAVYSQPDELVYIKQDASYDAEYREALEEIMADE